MGLQDTYRELCAIEDKIKALEARRVAQEVKERKVDFAFGFGFGFFSALVVVSLVGSFFL